MVDTSRNAGRKRQRSGRHPSLSCDRCYTLKKKCSKDRPCLRCANAHVECIYSDQFHDALSKHSITPRFSPSLADRILESAIQKYEINMDPGIILGQMRLEYKKACGPKMSNEAKAYLPDFETALDLARAYLHDHHVSYPFLDLEVLCENLLVAFDRKEFLKGQDLYRLYMVFAVGSLIKTGQDFSADSLELAKKFYAIAHSAISSDLEVPKIISYERTMLTVAYLLFFPKSSPDSLWDLIGSACRIVMGMGFNCEPPPGLSILLTEMRKRQFWSAYNADKLISTTLGRPYAISDEDVGVSYPSGIYQNGPISEGVLKGFTPSLAHIKSIIAFRTIEGQVYRSLFSRNGCFTENSREKLVEDLKNKADEWLKSTEQPHNQHLRPTSLLSSPIFHLELYYYGLVELIFRPSPVFPKPPENHLKILTDSIRRKLKLSLTLINSGLTCWNWILLYTTLEDAALLVYCYFQCSFDVRLPELLGIIIEILERHPLVWSVAHKASQSIRKVLKALTIGDVLGANASIRHFMITEYGHGSIYSVHDWSNYNLQRMSEVIANYLDDISGF